MGHPGSSGAVGGWPGIGAPPLGGGGGSAAAGAPGPGGGTGPTTACLEKVVRAGEVSGRGRFYLYHAVARAANQRYLEALAAVPPVSDSTRHLDRVSRPVKFQGRRRRPLNLLAGSEQRLFQAVLRGEQRLHGFRNADVARSLFAGRARTPAEQRRRTAHVSRLLQLLRAHGLIAQVPHSYRYRITSKGEVVMGAALYLRHRALDKLLKLLDEAA